MSEVEETRVWTCVSQAPERLTDHRTDFDQSLRLDLLFQVPTKICYLKLSDLAKIWLLFKKIYQVLLLLQCYNLRSPFPAMRWLFKDRTLTRGRPCKAFCKAMNGLGSKQIA